jgi:hypothetical protein
MRDRRNEYDKDELHASVMAVSGLFAYSVRRCLHKRAKLFLAELIYAQPSSGKGYGMPCVSVCARTGSTLKCLTLIRSYSLELPAACLAPQAFVT